MAGQWAFNEGPVKAHQSEWAWPGTLCWGSSSRQWWCWPAHQIQPGKLVHTASQCSKHVTCGWKILIEDSAKLVTHFFSISCKKIGEVSAYSQSLASVKTQLDEGRSDDCIYFLRGITHEKELIIVLLICVLMAQKLVDLSTTGSPRLIDGILLTKFDTIDDKVFCACAHLFPLWNPYTLSRVESCLFLREEDVKNEELIQTRYSLLERVLDVFQVGAALSMVYVSGVPVMFVGCGQTYTDLKKLNVKSIVKSLLV